MPYEIPQDLAGSYWGQILAAEPGFGPRTNPRAYTAAPVAGNTATFFAGGRNAPTPGQLNAQQRDAIYQSGGSQVTEAQGQKLLASGWTYGDPAPKGFVYDSFGRIADERSTAQAFGEVGLAAAPLVATAVTAGAAAPWLAATVGGAAALSSAKLGGASWKQALIAGGLGAAGAGLGASSLSTGVKVAGQAGIGAAGGAQNGGGVRGALLGAAQSGGAAAVAAAPKGGGTVATPTTPATSQSLTNYLIQAGLGAAAGAGGGATGIALGAGAGAAGAAAGTNNTQAAINAGTSLASRILSGAQAAGNTAGNAAAAREAGRATEAGNITTQDQQRLQANTANENALQGRATTEIAQRTEGRTSQNDAYRSALLANLALNTRDVSANRPGGVPTIAFSGGARPSAIGEGGRAAAEVMARRSMDTLSNPSPLMELPALEKFTPSALPKANGVDTALNAGGVIGNILTGLQQNSAANERSSLISALIQQSQQQASGGLDKPPVAAAPQARSLQDEIDAVNRRVSGGN